MKTRTRLVECFLQRGGLLQFGAALLLVLLMGNVSAAQYLRIRDICRVKGQETHALHGLGLVVGLKGTGDGETPTTRALAKMMELMGNPLGKDTTNQVLLKELEDVKNVAMVFVTATVPAVGARHGNTLNCVVNAISAKSIEGGYLMITPLLGSQPGNPTIYGYAQGAIALDNTGPPTSGKIHDGCRLEADFRNVVGTDGMITLVLDKNLASFQTAYDIADLLNSPENSGFGTPNGTADGQVPVRQDLARAIDQVNIEVQIPPLYREDPVARIAEILNTQIVPPKNDARVVIDERNGSIVIGDNVLVGRVAVTHHNLSIETGGNPTEGPLFVLDQTADTSTTRLKALVSALNALKVGPDDIIDIIKTLQRSGNLYGRLIIQ